MTNATSKMPRQNVAVRADRDGAMLALADMIDEASIARRGNQATAEQAVPAGYTMVDLPCPWDGGAGRTLCAWPSSGAADAEVTLAVYYGDALPLPDPLPPHRDAPQLLAFPGGRRHRRDGRMAA